MFKLRHNQLDQLGRQSRRAFHLDLVNRLRASRCEPILRLDDSALLDAIEVWHARGLSYGMRTERAMGRFLGMHLTVLPDFDQHEPVRQFLTTGTLSGEQKMAALFVRIRARAGS